MDDPISRASGGYPVLGTVLTCDLPRPSQRLPGAPVRFRLVGSEEAMTALHGDLSTSAVLALDRVSAEKKTPVHPGSSLARSR